MSGRDSAGAADSGVVRIRRAGSNHWEHGIVPARDGARVRGRGQVIVWKTGMLRLSKAIRDANGDMVLPGGIAVVTMAELRRIMSEGMDSIRQMVEFPQVRWAAAAPNLVVDEGLDNYLDVNLSGGTQITSWFVGFTDDTPVPAAGDTLASHGGWVEFDEYAGTRPAWVDGGVSAGSVDNSGSPASVVCNNSTNGGLGGIFLCEVTSGTAGILHSAVPITGGNRTVQNNDTIDATYTQTMADDAV